MEKHTSDYPHILSTVEGYLGHRTYGELMLDYFGQTSSCKLDLFWHNQERELHTRILNRLLSFYPSHHWIRKQNFDLYVFRFQIGASYMTRRLLRRKLAKANYSAFHLHTQTIGYLCVDLIEQLPTVVSIDRTLAQVSREKTDPEFRWTYGPNIHFERQVFQKAKSIVSFSEYARRSVIEDYDIEPEKVIVVYPGVDVNKITPANSKDSSTQNPLNILFVGGEFKRKGGYDVLEVFLDRFSDHANLHLVTQVPIKCDHPNVHIYNNVKSYTPEWLELYHQADMFVMPSYSEPFGWVFIEAMAAGLPIVATRLSAVPEMVTPGENGLLIEPGDRAALAQSIQHLIDNPTLRQEMGVKGRYLVEKQFNNQTHFEKLENLLHRAAIAQ